MMRVLTKLKYFSIKLKENVPARIGGFEIDLPISFAKK
jgi:hypothetical protein